MIEPSNDNAVGYCIPPKHTQFKKGQSGNPKGRPKGSQNVFTVLQNAARQRVKVKDKNGSRTMTKLEATVTQLSNQAASGDPRAIRDFLFWLRSSMESNQNDLPQSVPQEIDKPVIASILKRLSQSVQSPSAKRSKVKTKDSSEEGCE